MARYLIIKETECEECRGSGASPHPAWVEFYSNPDWRKVDDKTEWLYLKGWLDECGWPPAETDCKYCDGRGKVRKEIDLQQALDETVQKVSWTWST